MMSQSITMDDAPFNKFHFRVTVYTTGGMFCDGYIMGVIGIALALLTPQMHLSALWAGLIGSSALIGVFVGSLIFGWVTDRIGRQNLFTITIAFFVVASVLQFFVGNPVELFVLRLLMGIAMGADVAVATSLLAEFLPRKQRGPLLASINALWTVGYVVAIIVSFIMEYFGGDRIWRWMLVTSAVPSAIVLLLRVGMPESPHWLIKEGRIEEAQRVVKEYIGPDVSIDNLRVEENVKTNYRKLFSRKWIKRTLFAGLFWFCQVAPYYAILTFAPTVLSGFNVSNEYFGTLVMNLFQLVGAVVGVLVMNKLSRRGFLIDSFAIMAAALLILGFWHNPPLITLAICFIVYVFVTSAAGNIETVYPPELFPTEIRASGVGIASAISRVGAALGTFLLPISQAHLGIGPSLLIGAGILLFGLFISIAWAPETRNLTLIEASDLEGSSMKKR